MCLYPTLIRNRKYLPNKKNGGRPPIATDDRVKLIPIGCQKCIECIKQRGRQWQVRLSEEIRSNKNGTFVTLTFSNESITKLKKELQGIEGYELDNEIATLATRRFLERWRKKYGTSIKHWLVTELGHNGTENIHLHGIIFTLEKNDIGKIWDYGYTWIGDYVNERTISYIIKYTTKIDLQHSQYKPKILSSKGIGASYLSRPDANTNKYKNDGKTDESYTTRTGHKMALPIYYRNKVYSENEREKLWLEKLDKQERYVLGMKISIKGGYQNYDGAIKHARALNTRLRYGNNEKDYKKHEYELERRKLLYSYRETNTRDNSNQKTTSTKVLERRRDRKADQEFIKTKEWLSKIFG